jgi:hypothetical protein
MGARNVGQHHLGEKMKRWKRSCGKGGNMKGKTEVKWVT